jgi:hypothetical protein
MERAGVERQGLHVGNMLSMRIHCLCMCIVLKGPGGVDERETERWWQAVGHLRNSGSIVFSHMKAGK